jgi:hypothetical protein
MTRSPLFYPLNRGLDTEAGGVADLQTDVMRFMAILALCLVAIFALVQSIPLTPAPAEPVPLRTAAEPKPEVPPQEAPTEKRVEITRPKPRPARQIEPLVETVTETQAETTVPPAEPPVTDPPVVEPAGFTLRFASDLALTRLVARNEVGLYAIAPQKSLRMNVNRGALSFWPASVPNEFHEMDAATVPDDVQGAYRRASGIDNDAVKWGVTLPSGTQRQLRAYLSDSAGGTLIIDVDGNLRLEP